jgi:hypothetical protein
VEDFEICTHITLPKYEEEEEEEEELTCVEQ